MATARNLRDGIIKIADAGGTGGANVVTVDLEDGDLAWTEHYPATFISDRGVLDHARQANETPLEISFSMIFQSLSKHAATTPYDALTQTGGASGWVSDLSGVYAVIVEFTVDDPTGGADEVITFTEVVPEEVSFQEGDPYDRLSVRCRAPIQAPTSA